MNNFKIKIKFKNYENSKCFYKLHNKYRNNNEKYFLIANEIIGNKICSSSRKNFITK